MSSFSAEDVTEVCEAYEGFLECDLGVEEDIRSDTKGRSNAAIHVGIKNGTDAVDMAARRIFPSKALRKSRSLSKTRRYDGRRYRW